MVSLNNSTWRVVNRLTIDVVRTWREQVKTQRDKILFYERVLGKLAKGETSNPVAIAREALGLR